MRLHAGEVAVAASILIRDGPDRVDRAQNITLVSPRRLPFGRSQDAPHAPLAIDEIPPDVALDVVAIEDDQRRGREAAYLRQMARCPQRPEPHHIEPSLAQLGRERATYRCRLPFPGYVRNTVAEPEPGNAGDVSGMPPEMDRVEHGPGHARLRNRALESLALLPGERILAEPEHPDVLDLR